MSICCCKGETEVPVPRAQRVIITVEDGVVTGVFADNKDINTLVTVIDYDNIAAGDDDTEAMTVEAQIETGILKRYY